MKKFIIALFITFSFMLTSCQTALHNTIQNAYQLPEEKESEVIAQSNRIAEFVKSTPYVENATATVIGGRALIGIDLDSNFPDDRLAEVKRDVKARVLEYDTSLNKATITITPHLLSKSTSKKDGDAPDENGIGEKLEENAVPSSPTP